MHVAISAKRERCLFEIRKRERRMLVSATRDSDLGTGQEFNSLLLQFSSATQFEEGFVMRLLAHCKNALSESQKGPLLDRQAVLLANLLTKPVSFQAHFKQMAQLLDSWAQSPRVQPKYVLWAWCNFSRCSFPNRPAAMLLDSPSFYSTMYQYLTNKASIEDSSFYDWLLQSLHYYRGYNKQTDQTVAVMAVGRFANGARSKEVVGTLSGLLECQPELKSLVGLILPELLAQSPNSALCCELLCKFLQVSPGLDLRALFKLNRKTELIAGLSAKSTQSFIDDVAAELFQGKEELQGRRLLLWLVNDLLANSQGAGYEGDVLLVKSRFQAHADSSDFISELVQVPELRQGAALLMINLLRAGVTVSQQNARIVLEDPSTSENSKAQLQLALSLYSV